MGAATVFSTTDLPTAPDRRRTWVVALLTTAIVAAASIVAAPPAPVGAAEGDCGFTGPVATFLPASGSWSSGGNWDTNTVPTGGQICIPAGRTAIIDSTSMFLGSGGVSAKVQGTLRSTAAGNVFFGAATEVTGRVEVAAGSTLIVNNTGGFTNRAGAVVDIESGGAVAIGLGTFANLGGRIDLTGGGAFRLEGTARLVHGASADPTPVASTVTGGSISLVGGVLELTGSGAASFRVASGGNSRIEGTLASSQTIGLQCATAFTAQLRIAGSSLRNEGTISFEPKATATSCIAGLDIASGATLTNAGTIEVGASTSPADSYQWLGQGSVVNELDGVIEVAGSLYTNVPRVTTDGSIDVATGGSFVLGDSLFELRSGTITNNGSLGIGRSSPTFGFFGTFAPHKAPHVLA